MVRRLIELIRLRNQHAAFQGEFTLLDSSDAALHLRWSQGGDWAELQVDFAASTHALTYSTPGGQGAFAFS